jgi:DnaJ-domain-containing protein 1
MEEQDKEKEILFNKAISFFNENLYSMALYYFIPSKNITNEDIVDNYVKKCKELIKERSEQNSKKQFLNPREKIEEEGIINRILQSNNHYEVFGLSPKAKHDEIIEAYKKLIIKYHPDVSTSNKSEEIFKKLSKSYNKLINNNNGDINPYQLIEKVFADEDLVEILNNEKSNLEIKQFTIPPAIRGIGAIIRYGIFLYIFIYFVLPYFYTSSNETGSLYGFTRTVSNPFEKTSKRFKVKYYIGNEFKEKYISQKEIRNAEKEIEEKYLGYLNKTCEEAKENKEKLKKRLIYYKKGTANYNMIIEDISKLDLTICNKSDIYSKKYNNYKSKMENIDKNENEDNDDEDDEDNEKEKKEKEKDEDI